MYNAQTVGHFWNHVEGTQPPATPNGNTAGGFKVKFPRLSKTAFKELGAKGLPENEYLETIVLDVDEFKVDGKACNRDEALAIIKDDLALGLAVIESFVNGLSGASAKNLSKPRRG